MKRWKWHLKTTEILRFETAGSVNGCQTLSDAATFHLTQSHFRITNISALPKFPPENQ